MGNIHDTPRCIELEVQSSLMKAKRTLQNQIRGRVFCSNRLYHNTPSSHPNKNELFSDRPSTTDGTDGVSPRAQVVNLNERSLSASSVKVAGKSPALTQSKHSFRNRQLGITVLPSLTENRSNKISGIELHV